MVIPPDLKADWLNRIDEHKGAVSEKYLMVPYRIDDVYNALLKMAKDRINHGDVYQEDRASNSILFGAKKSFWTGGLTFKGYSTLEPTPDGGTLVYMYVKVVSSDAVLQELLNQLTDVLEKEYVPSTSVESLVNTKNRLYSSQDIKIYGSIEYDSTKNIHHSKGSAYSGIRFIIIGFVMLFAGLSGQFVLRFTNSSEALVAVALLILAYGFYKVISASRMNKPKSNISAEKPASVRDGETIDSNLVPQGKTFNNVNQNNVPEQMAVAEPTSFKQEEKPDVKEETVNEVSAVNSDVQPMGKTFSNMNKMDNNGKIAGAEPVISNPVSPPQSRPVGAGKPSFKEKLLKNKLLVGIGIIAIIFIIALVLSNPFSSNGYPQSDITGVTLTITDAHADNDNWYFVWGEITPMPDYIEDFKVVTNCYDSNGDLVTTYDYTIDPTTEVSGEIILSCNQVDSMDVSKIEVILLDPESKFVASDEYEIAG
jgi:hypothetical protein